MSIGTLGLVHAIEQWVADALPNVSRFDHPPAELEPELPIVVASIVTDAQADADQDLPGFAKYQQTLVRSWVLDVAIMVRPDPPEEASHTLYEYVDRLSILLRQYVRLGNSVVLSQFYNASYDPPEMQFADGTKVRLVTVRVTAGEMIGV